MNLEGIMLSEINQTQKDKYLYDSTYEVLEQAHLKTESRMAVARGWGRGDWRGSV